MASRVTSNRGIGVNSFTGYHNKRIQAGLSTQIIPVVVGEDGNEYIIGAIQSLTIEESRDLREVTEIGTDGIVAIVPSGPTKYSISIDRIVFDFSRLPQALQREYRHIHAQRRPFDIKIYDYNPYLTYTPSGTNLQGTPGGTPSEGTFGVDPSPQTTPGFREKNLEELVGEGYYTVLGNCWFESLSVSYRAGEYLVTENCRLRCEYIYDNLPPGKIIKDHDDIERKYSAEEGKYASIMSEFDTKLKE